MLRLATKHGQLVVYGKIGTQVASQSVSSVGRTVAAGITLKERKTIAMDSEKDIESAGADIISSYVVAGNGVVDKTKDSIDRALANGYRVVAVQHVALREYIVVTVVLTVGDRTSRLSTFELVEKGGDHVP